MEAGLVAETNRLVLRITGEMSFADNKLFRELAESMLAKDAVSYVLDISGLDQVDSAGLGMMLTLQQWGADKGVQVLLRYDEHTIVGKMVNLGKFNEMFELDS